MHTGSISGDASSLRLLTGDLRQLASVRRIVLDDGPERGLSAFTLSTGGGLDFWLLAGRTLDIGPLWWRGTPIAWQAPQGFAHPHAARPSDDAGNGIGRLISGFQTTCGLDRIRQASTSGPMHGSLGLAPARVLSAVEDWECEKPELRVEAEAVQYRLSTQALRLRRVVRAPIGGGELFIDDVVSNEGHAPQSHDLLYHFNLGYPGVRDGTTVTSQAARLLHIGAFPDTSHTLQARCMAVAQIGSACRVTTPLSSTEELLVDFAWSGDSLPYLQLWTNLQPRTGLLAIEPCTSERLDDGQSAASRPLQPGESRKYSLRLSFATRARQGAS
jgi:hypothetical protein